MNILQRHTFSTILAVCWIFQLSGSIAAVKEAETAKRSIATDNLLQYPVLKKRRFESKVQEQADVMHVANYLLKKDRNQSAHTTNDSYQRISAVKLQQLLYLAQCYSLAIYGEKLFDDAIVRHKAGAINRTVNNNYQEHSEITDEQLDTIALPANALNEQQKSLLDCILYLYQSTSEAELLREVEEGSPFQEVKIENAEITELSMQNYSRQAGPWARFVVQLLIIAENNDAIMDILEFAREYVSHKCLEFTDVTTIKEIFEQHRKPLEELLNKSWSSAKFVQWPEQSRYEACMGYLFFPIQYEHLFELSIDLTLRDNLVYMLAVSCFYKNMLAYPYLAKSLEMYDLDYDEEKETRLALERYFGIKTLEAVNKYTNYTASLNLPLPHRFCGFLCLTQCKDRTAQIFFLKGMATRDPWSTFHYGLEITDKEEQAQILENFSKDTELEQGMGKYLEARYLDDESLEGCLRRISLYKEAGSKGVALGFRVAAQLTNDRESAIELYKKATQSGILSAYDKIANLYMQQLVRLRKESPQNSTEIHSLTEPIEEAYRAKIAAGDMDGYLQLGNLYADMNEREKAFECYRKAGIHGKASIKQYLSGSKKREFNKESKLAWTNHFNKLKQIMTRGNYE